MLIDLDLAKEGKGPSGARHRTGTMEFMAIEVLLRISHTYRHDIEAFFYVLIWHARAAAGYWMVLRKSRRQGLFCHIGTQELTRTSRETNLATWTKGGVKDLILYWKSFHRRLSVLSPCAGRYDRFCSRIGMVFLPALQKNQK